MSVYRRKFKVATKTEKTSVEVVVKESFEQKIIDEEFASIILNSLDIEERAVIMLTAEKYTEENISLLLNISIRRVKHKKSTARQKAKKLTKNYKAS